MTRANRWDGAMVVGLAFIILSGSLLTKTGVQEEALKLEALPAPPPPTPPRLALPQSPPHSAALPAPPVLRQTSLPSYPSAYF